MIEKPKIKILETCEFPIIEKVLGNGYRVLELPQEVRKIFDEEGVHAVRINSKEIAEMLPSFGGQTPTGSSLLPHQDHHPLDQKRFLTLSQPAPERKGAQTLVLLPQLAKEFFPTALKYFSEHRKEIQKTAVYDASYVIPEKSFIECFETGDLQSVVKVYLGNKTDEESVFFACMGLLGYLIRGEHADYLMEHFYSEHKEEILIEEWKTPGVFIFDNREVFHARRGGSSYLLQRNWCI